MTVGIDTYVDVAKADEIVRLLLRPYDEFRVFWSVLSFEEKEGYILRSTQQIEALTYTGAKSDCNQRLQFPRNREKELSQAVQNAAVYNALGLMNEEIKSTAEKQMQVFKSLGVFKNPRLDQTSMRAIATAENAAPAEVKIPLASKKAYELLKPYRRGSFAIR
ncbi:MAG: hypothetical protein K2L12_00460 [Clostridia bacterium]|nr:hypothetical protein [Clostridia bacterium]